MPECAACGVEKDWFRPDDGSYCPLCAKKRRKHLLRDVADAWNRNLRKWLRHLLCLAHKTAYRNRPESKAKTTDAHRRRWSNREYRKRVSERQRAYRIANPELVRKSARRSRLAHLAEAKANGRLRLNGIRKRARRRALTCHLTVAWFRENIWGKPCLYCGRDCLGGIDRFDNSKAYEPNNCVPCCHWCNVIKGTLSIDSLATHLKRILEFQDALIRCAPLCSGHLTTSSQRFGKIRKSALKRKLSFGICLDWYCTAIWGKPCHYCGLTTTGGIDRIDSSQGYHPENCVPCCGNCNRIKWVYSPGDMVARVREIAHRLSLYGFPEKIPADTKTDLV